MVEVFGHDIDRELETAKSCIGLVPQEINFNMFETCYTIVVNQAGFYGIPRGLAKQRAEKYLKQLQLWDRRNSIARSLSGGMKRRLEITRGFLHTPKILFLDEPTLGLDPQTRNQLWTHVKHLNETQNTTVFLTTHYMDEAEYCNRISVMVDGKMEALDSPANLKKQYATESMDEVFYKLARGARRSGD